jgi:hypothetical protein
MRSLLLLSLLVSSSALAAPIKVGWRFTNVEPGYAHENRIDVYVDGNKVLQSTVKPENKPNKLKLELKPGPHQVRFVNLALYEGTWEEHTIENDYSVDCLWQVDVPDAHPKSIRLVCDIDSEATWTSK